MMRLEWNVVCDLGLIDGFENGYSMADRQDTDRLEGFRIEHAKHITSYVVV